MPLSKHAFECHAYTPMSRKNQLSIYVTTGIKAFLYTRQRTLHTIEFTACINAQRTLRHVFSISPLRKFWPRCMAAIRRSRTFMKRRDICICIVKLKNLGSCAGTSCSYYKRRSNFAAENHFLLGKFCKLVALFSFDEKLFRNL